MKNSKNTKFFIMFLSGILFSAFTVFAATISVNTDLTQDAVQYLQKLVLTDSDGSTTGVVLDGTSNKVMSDTICDTSGYNCKLISELITGVDLSDYLTGSALESYLSGTDSFLTGTDGKWCTMSGSQIACTEDEPTGGTSLWETGYDDKIYYNGGGEVGIGTANPWSSVKLTVNGGAKFGGELYLDSTLNDSSEITSEEPIKFSDYLGSSTITMLINTSSGYVGIGTDDPQSKLHVNGTIQAGDNLKIFSTSNDGVIMSQRHLILNTSGSNEQIRITNLGKVGVGTNDPQYKLDVNGTGYFSKGLIVDGVGKTKGGLIVRNDALILSMPPTTCSQEGLIKYFKGEETSGAGNLGHFYGCRYSDDFGLIWVQLD